MIMEKNTDELKLMKDTINRLTKKVNELEIFIEQVSVPIIPSVLPNTILIPLAGELSPERFQMFIPKILNYVHNSSYTFIIIDFTAISIKEIADLAQLSTCIENLTASLKIMGAEVIVVGFSPQLSQELVKSDLEFIKELKAFSTFKKALEFLMEKMGLALVKVSDSL